MSAPTAPTRTRTPSISATTVILHADAHPHPHTHAHAQFQLNQYQHQQQEPAQESNVTFPFHQMHPWSTKRAMIAAESEISPPVSPKQQAVLVGSDMGTGAIENDTSKSTLPPVGWNTTISHRYEHEQSNSDAGDGDDGDDEDSHHDTLSENSNDHDSDDTLSSPPYAHSHFYPYSSYTHQRHHHHSLQGSPTSANHSMRLEPVSAGLLLSRLDYSSSTASSSSVSVASSASSSSTSLSSVSSSKSARNVLSSSTVASAPSSSSSSSSSSSLGRLEIERTSELLLFNSPPSSHASSPSSPSYPALKGGFGFPSHPTTTKMTTTTTATTTTTTSSLHVMDPKETATTTSKRAPWHCTKKSIPQIIREISEALDGRDKMIKVVQYFAKVFLWLFLSNPVQYKVLATRIKALAKQFSTTRKVFRLGHFVDPLASVLMLAVTLKTNVSKHGLRRTVMTKPATQTWRNSVRDRLGSLNTVLGFVQDISDDIYCLGAIGVLDRDFTDKAEPWSNRLWMMGVSIDLHENLQSIRDVKEQIKALESKIHSSDKEEEEEERAKAVAQHLKLRTKLHWLQVTTVKLGGDFLFCAYDNLHCSFSDGFQAVTGLISGIAGAYKFVGKVMES
ncbi:hypothetical protein BX616_010132 [Lobosporangium transversale]|uniref:Peroxisomal biogenesis factor 11 n=1 Tax=Lobosporangium transversale TaxID=64571 RepID=A0A1Y2GUL5_9FUNG|nr:hypothetical protein BCR41DRAFT_384620 [Lobosporangium transversale]KAF9913225.1 hypothetical protein BX616_010132 [Lobosporangium transversale]ORZ24780.1 hypothetical protein BCR41DRAFT_384620 [Lobosporangium transversale]|eukprot:XP_021883761.1 hypothetical protein BCR41DRAFT_384620 [Lobosporangium transversale]